MLDSARRQAFEALVDHMARQGILSFPDNLLP